MSFSHLISQKFLGYCIFCSGAHRTRVSLIKNQKSFWLKMRPLNSFNLAKSLSQHFRWSIKTLEAYWTQIWYSKYQFSVNLHKLGHLSPFCGQKRTSVCRKFFMAIFTDFQVQSHITSQVVRIAFIVLLNVMLCVYC